MPCRCEFVLLIASIGVFSAAAGARAQVELEGAFFGSLPEDYQEISKRCVERRECEDLDRLNKGPQFFAVTVWDRELTDALLVSIEGSRLDADARDLDRLIGQYYIWPADLPRRGRINIFDLPGLTIERRGGLAIALTPQEGYARELTFGGYRIVRPAEFDIPGRAVFGDFNVNTNYKDDGNLRARFDGAFGAQWKLTQFRSRASFDTDENQLFFDYAYMDRPILSKAVRLRAGYMDAVSDCRKCYSGPMVGASIAKDSLGGLLYSPADTAFFDVTVDGDIDEIEILVNGRSVRTERAFPGYHTVAVTSLEDGPNFIEIFGIDSDSGARRLLASGERLAGAGVLAKAIVEYRMQAGWAVKDSRFAFEDGLDFDLPFIQLHQTRGLGKGREFDGSFFLNTEAILAETELGFRLGNGRAGVLGIGSLSNEALGGGVGLRANQRFGIVNIGASGNVCFDCYNAGALTIDDGLVADASAYLSTEIFGWSASASINFSSAERQKVGWRANLRRSAFGGYLNIYARDEFAVSDAGGVSIDQGLTFGFRFSKFLGGPRRQEFDMVIDNAHGDLTANANYRNSPLAGDGFSTRASVSGINLYHLGDKLPTLSAGLGYQDSLMRSSVDVTHGPDSSMVDLNLGTGFALVDGQFVITRSPLTGGVFASGLTPGSPILVDDAEYGKVNRFGHAHLAGLRRGEAARVAFDERFAGEGTVTTREAELQLVPGLFYGIGDKFRKQERTYLLLVGPDRRPISAGIFLYNKKGDEIGYAGFDGIVTLTGTPGVFEFEDGERVCEAEFTGNEAVISDMPTLRAACRAQ